ncbi:hypothetical protein BDV95DRAFT_605876 [Massariosphaeria phaeospora]|uniref:Rhodopsin domain-containing protein n=1 Tax=Massariosphaeria phaeospora TaxID=100035 RepID=A0A7C8MPX4_9PLEO|nr:hypothetical protein BDV95DRAFT_605876 [Massariosphaeria phaeospora]
MAALRRQAPLEIPTDPAYYAWTIQPRLTAIDISLLVLALVTVLARLYIRVVVLKLFRLDDAFIAAAMVCSIASCGIFLYVVQLGMGKHIFAIPPDNIKPLLMWIFVVGVVIPLAVCFVKISIACFLLPLTGRTGLRGFLWGIVVFLVCFALFTFLSLMFGCMPVAANWDFALRPPPMGTGTAKCLSLTAYRNIALFNSVTNIITDIILALLPVPLIWTLHLNIRTKASLMLILSLGFFACAAGIIKTPLLFHFFDDIDSTGPRSMYYAWQIIEMNLGITAASLPSLKPAFRWLLDTARALTSSMSANRTAGSASYAMYRPRRASGYLRHDDDGLGLPHGDAQSKFTIDGSSTFSEGTTVVAKRLEDGADLEMQAAGLGGGLERYRVRIRGNEKGAWGAGAERGGLGADEDDGEGSAGDGGLSVAKALETGQIVKTTKVTVVSS